MGRKVERGNRDCVPRSTVARWHLLFGRQRLRRPLSSSICKCNLDLPNEVFYPSQLSAATAPEPFATAGVTQLKSIGTVDDGEGDARDGRQEQSPE
jgi:hypothetical protein